MKIVGFYTRKASKDKKVKEIKIDINKAIMKAAVTVVLLDGLSYTVYAGGIADSFNPLINVIKDLAEPVAYGFMIKGFMKIMTGEDHEGWKTIKYSIGGYIGIQWIPNIFNLLKSIKIGG